MSWDFILALVSFASLLVAWVALPVRSPAKHE